MADPKPKADSTIEDLFGGGGIFGEPNDRVGTAARRLADALSAHKGRRKALGAWKPVVRKALRVSKMGNPQFDAVVQKGTELGLFHVDSDSLEYPLLVTGKAPKVAAPKPKPKPRPKAKTPVVPPPRADDPAPPTPPKKVAPPRKRPPANPPADWCPPEYLDCGHWDWQTIPDPDWVPKADPKAKGSGMAKHPTISVKATSPDDCPACKAGKMGHPQQQRGKYKTPVPMSQRRTKEKDDGMGFPGYCCDEGGYYIGGVGNFCRYNAPKGPWCEAHGGSKPALPKAMVEAEAKPKRKRKRKAKPKGILADADKGAGIMDVSEALAKGVRDEG
jgi:hypothetical protein